MCFSSHPGTFVLFTCRPHGLSFPGGREFTVHRTAPEIRQPHSGYDRKQCQDGVQVPARWLGAWVCPDFCTVPWTVVPKNTFCTSSNLTWRRICVVFGVCLTWLNLRDMISIFIFTQFASSVWQHRALTSPISFQWALYSVVRPQHYTQLKASPQIVVCDIFSYSIWVFFFFKSVWRQNMFSLEVRFCLVTSI